MAYAISREVTTPRGDSYHGPSSQLVMAFSGTPGLSGTIAAAINAGTGWTPGLRGKLLHYVIEQDTAPIFDGYRVTVDMEGAPERESSGTVRNGVVTENGVGSRSGGIGAWPAIIVIAIAIGILALFGALTFKLARSSWKDIGGGIAAGLGPLLLIGGGLFIAYQALAKKGVVPRVRRNPRNPRNPEKGGGGGMLGIAAVGVGALLMLGGKGTTPPPPPPPPPPPEGVLSNIAVKWS